ncbi:hypothetical protein 1 [Beihai picorna-like virus 115]|uniref:hypothetical protein 1 n=1 Tax=Beihai picorna-like virus 115 TaxID=1922544 RepID=UPI00090C8946|nr:hypothetical protein 1 [Beihai picorna-like virus 115]APG76767.1 hypothetical protein 1 [Beihai picorna-like virus 115]
MSNVEQLRTLFVEDYSITGLGLLKHVTPDGRTQYLDPKAENFLIIHEKEIMSTIKTMWARGLDNLRFDKMRGFLSSLKKSCNRRLWMFLQTYIVVLAELYPDGDLVSIISQEIVGSLQTNGVSVAKLFENFFTLLISTNITLYHAEMMLAVLYPSDIERCQELFGFIDLLPSEQMFGFFSDVSSGATDLADAMRDLREMASGLKTDFSKMSSTVNVSIASLSETFKFMTDTVKQQLSPGGSTFETLGFFGEMLDNIRGNLPYIVSKFVFMISDGVTAERLLDIASIVGLTKFLFSKFGGKLMHFFTGAQEQIDMPSLYKFLFTPDGLMNMWKIDRGIVGAANIIEYIKKVLILLEVIPDKDGAKFVEVTSILDNLDDVVQNYTRARIEHPRSLLDPNHLKILQGHLKEISELTGYLESTRDSVHSQRCAFIGLSLKRLYSEILIMQRQSNQRVEPVGVCILGAGGIGKSHLLTGAPAALSSRAEQRMSLPVDNPLHLPRTELLENMKFWQCWSQNQDDKYSSGYEQQEIHNVDDAFQDREDRDHLQYFTTISSVPFPTNQAGLDSKGKPYSSRLVQLSANSFPTRSETVRDIRALARRFTLLGVVFNGDDEAYQNFLNHPPENHDPTFRHLLFYKMSGFDYVTHAQHQQAIGQGMWQQISYTDYIDMLIEKLLMKQRLFDQRIGAEEQSAGEIVDMNLWGHLYVPASRGFYNQDAEIIDTIKPLKGTFLKTLRMCKFGTFPCAEFPVHWDISRVVNSVNIQSTLHIGKMFSSETPVTFRYIADGERTDLIFPKMGPDFDPQAISIIQTPIGDEDNTQYQNGMPQETLYGKLKTVLMNMFGKSKELVSWILFAVKSLLFPDMTGWSVFAQMYQTALTTYTILISCVVVFAYFFGTQMLGNVPTCTSCMSDHEKNEALLAQWIIMNRYHDQKCGMFKCDKTCKWLKQHRVGVSKCENDVGCLFWKKKCAYSEQNLEPFHEVIKGIGKENYEIIDPYLMATDLCEKCKLGESQVPKWFNVFERAYTQQFGIAVKSKHVLTEEEMYSMELLFVEPCQLESGESKRIVRKKAKLESGDSKRIVRKKANLEINRKPGFTCQSVETEGASVSATYRQPISILEGEIYRELVNCQDAQPEDFDDVAEQYGLKISRKPRKGPVLPEDVDEEASIDPNCRPLAVKAATKAVYVMNESGEGVLLRGIPVGTKHFLTPAHLQRVYTIGESFTVKYMGQEYQAKMVKARPEWDLAMCEMITPCQMVSQLKHIPSASELIDRVRANSSGLIAVPSNDSVVCMSVNMTLNTEYQIHFRDGKSKDYDHLWVATTLAGLGADTQSGDCGSPVFLMCTKTNKKLVGMHIAGAKTFSAFAVITQERVSKLLDVAQEEIDTSYPLVDHFYEPNIIPFHVKDPINAPVGAEKEIIGQRQYERPCASQTAIKKHPCHGLLPVTTKPAYLSYSQFKTEHPDKLLCMTGDHGDVVELNLMTKNTSKWCKPLPQSELITSELAEMEEELTDYWRSVFAGENLDPISIEDAVSGNPAFNLEPMNLKSSPGIPYNTQRGVHSKAAFVKPTGEVMLNGAQQLTLTDDVKRFVERRLENAAQGKRVMSIWKDCLKDETRDIKKVDEGKTRIFTAAPLDFTVALRVLMGRFKAVWLTKGHLLGHSVGIDCLSPQWAQLYRRLIEVSDHGFDCDYSSYDGNLRSDFMYAALRIFATVISENVGDPNLYQTIMTLCSECVETIQQSGDCVWMSKHGNPSGNPLTTELNCTVNFMYHWFCFRQILGKDNMSLKDFFENVGFACFGDDAVYTFRHVDEVTFEKMQYWMKELGQDYTNAQKSDDMSALTHIEELSFLKRKFKPCPISKSVVFSPIDPQSIEGQFNWCSYEHDAAEILQDTYENSLIEYAQHGKEAFNKFVNQIHPAFDDHLKSLIGKPTPKPRFASYRSKLIKKLTK